MTAFNKLACCKVNDSSVNSLFGNVVSKMNVDVAYCGLALRLKLRT